MNSLVHVPGLVEWAYLHNCSPIHLYVVSLKGALSIVIFDCPFIVLIFLSSVTFLKPWTVYYSLAHFYLDQSKYHSLQALDCVIILGIVIHKVHWPIKESKNLIYDPVVNLRFCLNPAYTGYPQSQNGWSCYVAQHFSIFLSETEDSLDCNIYHT